MAKSTLLLDAHLKALRLPTFLRESRQGGAALRSGRAGLGHDPIHVDGFELIVPRCLLFSH